MRESGRIPGSFAISWEQRKVGELIKDGIIDAPLDGNHGEKHPTASEYVDSGIPFLMASDVHGGIADIKSCKFITRERAERLDKGFAKNGDVLLTHKATIGESAILQGLETEYAVLTPQVTYYRIQDEKKLSREYLYAFFNSVKFQNDLKTKAAQSTRPYIGISAQQNLDIVLPRKLTEQKKIGVYFSDLDHLITLHQRKLCVLCILERLLYENIKQFEVTVSWEQRKAIDIADYSKGNGYSKGDLIDVGTPIILYGRLYTKYQFAISEVDTFAVPRNGAVYSQGNEVIVPASGETAEDIARASAVEKSGVLLGGDLNILRPFDFINPLFLALAISNGEPQKELAKKAQGKSVVHIHNTDIQEVTIAYPSRTEQDRIVSVFRQLDHLITLHQRKP